MFYSKQQHKAFSRISQNLLQFYLIRSHIMYAFQLGSYCTYNSINSTAMFVKRKPLPRQILASMLSVVGVDSCLTKYGGLCSEQHVLLEKQFSPSHRGSLE